MKIKNQFLALGAIALFFTSCDKKENTTNKEGETSKVELKNTKDSLSYALGANLSNSIIASEKSLEVGEKINQEEVIKAYNETLELLKGKSHSYRQGFITALQKEMLERQIDTTNLLSNDLLIAGLKDGMNEAAILDEQAGQMAFQKYLGPLQQKAQEKMQKRAEARMDIVKKENEEKGNKFLEAKKKEGYKETTSGLLYKVIKEGDKTKKPNTKDVAQVIYTGKLISGKEFDSSKGAPVGLPVERMVPGFKEALLMMGKGAKYQIILPSKLGYGENGNARIEPNSVLLFDLELTDFGKGSELPSQPQLSQEQLQELLKKQGK